MEAYSSIETLKANVMAEVYKMQAISSEIKQTIDANLALAPEEKKEIASLVTFEPEKVASAFDKISKDSNIADKNELEKILAEREAQIRAEVEKMSQSI